MFAFAPQPQSKKADHLAAAPQAGTAATASSGAAALQLKGASYEQASAALAPQGPATCTVRPGDSLAAIAARELGSQGRWRDIWNLNREVVPNPNLIQPGQVLKLPGSAAGGVASEAPVAAPAPATDYVVQRGDTLAAIASRALGAASRWPEIWALNKGQLASPSLIYPGQVLKLPGSAAVEVTEPAPGPAEEEASGAGGGAADTPAGEFWTYTVQTLDTLSYIAQKTLGSSSRWQEIWQANKEQIPNPSVIKVGMQLKIPGKEGSASSGGGAKVGPPGGSTGGVDVANLSPVQAVAYKVYQKRGAYIAEQAGKLGFESAVAGGVLITESSGSGYGSSGKLKIRFEPHIFHGYTGSWVADSHQSQAAEYQAFEAAKAINEAAAFKSISMGAAQIMGFNAESVGYTNAAEMFDAMQVSEVAQLDGLFSFIAGRPVLVSAAQSKDWHTFAKYYNGPGYLKGGYHIKLANYYEAYKAVEQLPADVS